MEAMLGISLHSYLYLKLAKMPRLSFISYVFSSTKLEQKRAEEDLPRNERGKNWAESRGRMSQTMYTHRNK
jgi:hypothetical protein